MKTTSAHARLRPIADPRFLIALVLLVVNDHFWKATYGNAITGKISDFAGLIVLPVVLAGVIGAAHGRSIVLATGSWFALMKTLSLATAVTVASADAVLPWGNAIVTDPTDLVALPALVVALDVIRHPIDWPVPKVLRVAVFIGAALASVATSTPEEYTDYDNPPSYQTEGCRPSKQTECFRFFEGAHIEQSADAGQTWTTVWQVDASSAATRRSAVDRDDAIVPYDIEVTDSDVFVSFENLSGRVRLVKGRWSPSEASFRDIPWDSIAGISIIAVLVVLTVAGIIARRRSDASNLIPLQIAALVLAVFALVIAIASAFTSNHALVPFSIFIVVPALPLIVVSGLILAGGGDPLQGYNDRGRWLLLGLVLVAALVPVLPFVLWSSYGVFNYTLAMTLAVLLALGAMVGALGLAQTAGR